MVTSSQIEQFGDACDELNWDKDPEGGIMWLSGERSGKVSCTVDSHTLELNVSPGADAVLRNNAGESIGVIPRVDRVRTPPPRGAAGEIAVLSELDDGARSSLTLRRDDSR